MIIREHTDTILRKRTPRQVDNYLTFTHIPKDVLIDLPNHEMWIDNPGGVLRAELNAFYQRLWNIGKKLRLNVHCTQGYVTPEGGDPISMQWPLDVHVD